MSEADRLQRVEEAARSLAEVERSVRVLRSISWPAAVKERFLRGGTCTPPVVEYAPFDGKETRSRLRSVLRSVTGDSPEEAWLRRVGEAVGTAAEMLGAAGTPAFSEGSQRLFGSPKTAVLDGRTTPLELAQHVDELAGSVSGLDLGAPDPACHLAQGVAERIRAAVAERFGSRAPEVVLTAELSANALAGPRRIQVRDGACFTDRDVHQPIHHEAFVHVCTFLNGREQTRLPILGAGHSGTTRTQEGLAVFAELIAGVMDPHRFHRLARRVIAIQMAIDGADFVEVYRYFLESSDSEDQAFESARRVFRGGVTGGGAPFTKDVVYLDGLLRVSSFMHAAVAEQRVDCLLLLFCGKLDLQDVGALALLVRSGLCRLPRFLPPWLEDRRFLVCQLAYSSFLNGVDFPTVREGYARLFREMPRIEAPRPATAEA